MIHQHFVATILTILLVGTIPTSLLTSNNSGLEISTLLNHNFAYAAQKTQTENSDDKGGSTKSSDISPSEASGAEKLQEKVKELLLEASKAKIIAARAMNAANNATEEAESLSSAADEADEDVKRLLKSVDDESKQERNGNETRTEEQDNNNNELSTALSEAKEKRKAASLVENDAKDLSNKADSLNKAAIKAEKLAEAAQKDLENAISDSSSSIQKTNKNDADANANTNVKKDKSVNNSDHDPTDKKSDNIQSDTTPLEEERDDFSKEASIKNNSSTSADELNVIQTLNNRSEDPQGLASGSNYKEILDEAEKNALRMRSDQSPIGNMVNNSISTRDGLPQDTPEVNSSTLINRASVLDEINKQIDNVTGSNNETDNVISDINPVSNSTNDNTTLISSSANNTTIEFEGLVDCEVSLDNVTTADNSILSTTSSIQEDGADGGCYPEASTSGEYQYVVWSEGDEDNRYILFKRSMYNKGFENAVTLSGNIPSAVFNPKVTTEGNNVYVVWQGDSESGNQDILMRKSENNGKSFGDVINLSNDRAGSGNPEINVNSSSVYVVWDGTTPGNNDIYLRRSINNGTDFDKVRNLSTDGAISYEPKVVLDKKGLEIYWRDYRNGHEEILAKKSLNEGRTFEIIKNLDKDVLDLWKDRSISAGRS
jgi:hypothetical protein